MQSDDRLMETSWGEWQGSRLADLRGTLGTVMTEMEGRGWDFRPPGGESPRDVSVRLQAFINDIASGGKATVAVNPSGRNPGGDGLGDRLGFPRQITGEVTTTGGSYFLG